VLVAVAALAAPSLALASPRTGHYAGNDGVAFHVRLSPHGTLTVEDARYHAHAGFAQDSIHEGSFATCARVRINSVLHREYCIHGEFGSHDHAWGTVKVFHGAHGHTAHHASETHHWSAVLTG